MQQKNKWPTIEDKQIKKFCDTIVFRGAIALRYLDKDESGRVTREEFNEIGNAEFWTHVDFLSAVDADGINEEGFDVYLDDFPFEQEVMESPKNLHASAMIETNYRNYVDYTKNQQDKLHIDTIIVRPSFCKEKYLSPSKSKLELGLDEILSSTPREYLKALSPLNDRGISTSTSCLNEEDIDPRLIDISKVNVGDAENRSSSEAHDFSLNERNDSFQIEIEVEMGSDEYDCRGEDV